MEGNLKDILSHLSPEIDQETLLLYLQGKLPPEKQHEVEQHIMENEFAADALEGLRNVKDPQQLSEVVQQLNTDLRKNTARKKKRKKEPASAETWLVVALAIILILIIISYFIIHRQLNEG